MVFYIVSVSVLESRLPLPNPLPIFKTMREAEVEKLRLEAECDEYIVTIHVCIPILCTLDNKGKLVLGGELLC